MIHTDSNTISLEKIQIKDAFWTPQIDLVREVVIPYQWDILNDRVEGAEKSHAIKNLKIAAGIANGDFYGFLFQDTDVAKWLEAVAYSLQTKPDEKLEALADEVIELVGKAQDPCGYLDTYFTISNKERRFTNLEECHELYIAGHFIEAGVAYYEATGKKNLLDIVCKLADYLYSVFGPEEEKLHGYSGHEEIELALIRLYKVTDNKKFVELSKYFIDERGKDPYYFEEEWEKRKHISEWTHQETSNPATRRSYLQGHKLVREQKVAEGHAVRMVYLLTGMIDVARETGDEELLEASKTLYQNIVTKQMYITGGIGSTKSGEAFSFDYDLPNDLVYAETCASIGLIVSSLRFLELETKGVYADVIEKALFNIILASMSKDGKHFFYVNPLEVWPEACSKNPEKFHVKAVRQAWFGCACCPPNLARLLTSLGKYIYTNNDSTIFVHQYISSEVDTNIDKNRVNLKMSTEYPWNKDVHIAVMVNQETEFTVALRIPCWCNDYQLQINGVVVETSSIRKDGYVYITRTWSDKDEIALSLSMPIKVMQANPFIRADAGKVAIQRGPVVYCIEENDNGSNLSQIELEKDAQLVVKKDDRRNMITIQGKAKRYGTETWNDDLYRERVESYEEVILKAIPYYAWGNENPGEMQVWIRG